MKMTSVDYVIRKVTFHERTDGKSVLYAMARFSGMSMDWPEIIRDEKSDKSFKFQSNEVMEDHMVGCYSGYASFVEV